MPKKHTSRLAGAIALALASMGAAHAVTTYNPDNASPPALATGAPSFECDSPVLTVPEDNMDNRALFATHCRNIDSYSIAPSVLIAGVISTEGDAPYLIDATYTVDGREPYAIGATIDADEALWTTSGSIRTSTNSLAALPRLIERQLAWDGANNLLSIEEQTDVWRVFNVNRLKTEIEPLLVDAGLVSQPITNGVTVSKVVLDYTISRFAPTTSGAPTVTVQITARNGQLEVQNAATLEANKQLIQDALDGLDRKGSDMQRAWALAAPAQYLNLRDEVLYAEKKVAAFNPHLLEQFQTDVRQILPLALPR